jgi:hypothetical protein
MKIYILTSVALFAEYGDLSSMDSPSISTSIFPTLKEARAQMKEELVNEKEEAESSGYTNYKTKHSEREASFENGEIGSGCSWNLVTWEITEKKI